MAITPFYTCTGTESPRRGGCQTTSPAGCAAAPDPPCIAMMDDEELQKVYQWVDEIPLSRPKRNIARDFSFDFPCDVRRC